VIEIAQDREHAARIVNWFSVEAVAKYARGIKEHGGHLPDKGGLLAEAEAECLDLPIYIRTIREQLERAVALIQNGRGDDAVLALNIILYGTPADRLPIA
jgi:hypothetical protein